MHLSRIIYALNETLTKFEIVQTREWGPADEFGVVEHIGE